MALPKLNNTPYYDVTIPSTGEKTRYRPYLVKEEKVLLMAAETEDEHAMSEAMLSLICDCVEGTDRYKLTSFDIQYLFLQLRSKSVGETSTLLFTCNCQHENKVIIKISDINVEVPEDKKDKIELAEDMTVELKYPTYSSLITDKIIRYSESATELMYQSVMLSLDALQVKDERMIFAEEPLEDIVEFVGNLSTEQFAKLTEFTNNIPQLKHEIEYTCAKCKTVNKSTVEGTADFFI